ncbi:glutathione synthase [Dyella subtropica]|uniref:glutathione synthase n=1 Tax=Dyella subtropica TaxID=2992127 RepID=UPI00225B9B9A|nr:glutathione synthase [Dyella subtropica]
MTLSVAVLMDPIGAFKIAKDTTFAMLLEAQHRGHAIYTMEQGDLAVRDGEPWARLTPMRVKDDPSGWFTPGEARWRDLRELDVVLMRKDPPVDSQFIYDTMVLELAQRAGVKVINDPQALRDCNEKMYALSFPQCMAPTLVARDPAELRRFAAEHGEVVLKPLDGMGGRGIFRVKAGDTNLNSMLETLLAGGPHGEGRHMVMAQKYIPQISAGDKRILIVDGEPVPYALARIPQGNEFRGNLAAGGRGEGVPLSDRDRWIVAQVAPELRRRGLLFVGLDVIGDYLTEINVTSPTCARELDKQFGLNIAGQLFDVIETVSA